MECVPQHHDGASEYQDDVASVFWESVRKVPSIEHTDIAVGGYWDKWDRADTIELMVSRRRAFVCIPAEEDEEGPTVGLLDYRTLDDIFNSHVLLRLSDYQRCADVIIRFLTGDIDIAGVRDEMTEDVSPYDHTAEGER